MAGDRGRRRKRYAQDPELRQKILVANRACYATHRDEILARRRQRYAEDPEYRRKISASNKASRTGRKAAYNAQRRLRYQTDPQYRERYRAPRRGERGRRSWLKTKYGMTPEDYDALLARQNGACAICRTRPGRRLGVDHCHATSTVRGLLCHGCNLGIGAFKDQPTSLRAAAAYVEAARARSAMVGAAPAGRASPLPEISPHQAST
jgi:hypothetical protein